MYYSLHLFQAGWPCQRACFLSLPTIWAVPSHSVIYFQFHYVGPSWSSILLIMYIVKIAIAGRRGEVAVKASADCVIVPWRTAIRNLSAWMWAAEKGTRDGQNYWFQWCRPGTCLIKGTSRFTCTANLNSSKKGSENERTLHFRWQKWQNCLMRSRLRFEVNVWQAPWAFSCLGVGHFVWKLTKESHSVYLICNWTWSLNVVCLWSSWQWFERGGRSCMVEVLLLL